MLDQTQPVPIPSLPGVQIYRDDRRPERFYAYSRQPHLACEADGTPMISVLFYGKKIGGALQLTGAMVTLTTGLAFSEAESEQLRTRLSEWRRQELGLPDHAPPATVEIVSPEWMSGTVVVHLDADLTLQGTPSLIGANEAALSLSLNADQARKLQSLWKAGLPKATIRYELHSQAVNQRGYEDIAAQTGTYTVPGHTAHYSLRRTFDASMTKATPFTVEVEGPLGLSATELQALTQEIAL